MWSVAIAFGALALGLRNYWFMKYANVRKSQQQLRSDLKDTLRPHQARLDKALNQLAASRMPSDSTLDGLSDLRDAPATRSELLPSPEPAAV